MSRKGTNRTIDSTIVAMKKSLEEKRGKLKEKGKAVEGHDYVFFYYAIGEEVTAKDRDVLRLNREIWQNALIDYMEKSCGSISGFLDTITEYVQKLPLRSSFKLIDYSRNKSLPVHLAKYFLPINGSKKIKPEHAIEYHLLYKTRPTFGTFLAYEFPLDLNNYFGGIDLIAYNQERKELRLIELKKAGFKQSEESREMFLRAYTEIVTYRACFDMLMKEKRAFMQKEFDKLGKKKNFEINLDDVTIINCILGPASLYDDLDSRLCDFVKTTKNESYKVELYSLSVHEEEIMQHPIGHPEMMIEIEDCNFH